MSCKDNDFIHNFGSRKNILNLMKKKIFRHCLCCLLLAAAAACGPRERTVVLLSTNDIHARIQRFPQLAAAVKACRDTADVVFLVDAGDRWTGNAYVDLAENRRPVLELMNRLGYDAATLGNHEFDAGHAVLGDMLRFAEFPVVCANLRSDTAAVPQTPPGVVVEKDGVRVGFVGVVTNFEGEGRPAGHADRFAGLTFPDPLCAARRYESLAGDCDLLVLISHMGATHDRDLLAEPSAYDLVIGGHSHEVIDERIGATLLTQTGKNLQYVGATTVRLRGHEVVSTDFRLVPLDAYAPDPEFAAEVERYYAAPALHRVVGRLGAGASHTGLANLITDRMAARTGAEVAFYHIGGVRLDTLAPGDVELAVLYDLEPFGTTVVEAEMTPAQMRRMILAKYNDPVNTKESHRIDIYSTEPYAIEVGPDGEAVDVRFPGLREGRVYRVAMSDYMYKKYEALEYDAPRESGPAVLDLLREALESTDPLLPDNAPRQTERHAALPVPKAA